MRPTGRTLCCMVLTLVTVALVTYAQFGEADTVVTKQGTTIEGEVVAGFPSVVTIQTTGGTLQINLNDIQLLKRASQDIIKTKDGSIYKGTITSTFPDTLKIQIQAGVMDVKWASVQSVTLKKVSGTPGASAPQMGNLVAIVETKDGSQEKGKIDKLPNTIEVTTSGGTVSLRIDGIQQLIFGEPDTVKTWDGSVFKGKITTEFPDTLQLEQSVGVLSIKTANIRSITLQLPSNTPTVTPLPSVTAFNPWQAKYVVPEALVGTFGGAIGGVIGIVFGLVVGCSTGNDVLCPIFIAIGNLLGSTLGAVYGVQEIASIYHVKGNKTLSRSLSFMGALLFGRLGPGGYLIGAGVGATIGYNVNATIEAESR